MSYVIYNIKSTQLFRVRARSVGCYKDSWASKGAARRAFNAANLSETEYAIADSFDFTQNIEKTVKVKNLMTGELVEERVNTPSCCSVGSERYWSM